MPDSDQPPGYGSVCVGVAVDDRRARGEDQRARRYEEEGEDQCAAGGEHTGATERLRPMELNHAVPEVGERCR